MLFIAEMRPVHAEMDWDQLRSNKTNGSRPGSAQVFLDEVRVDGEGRLRAFCGGHDDPLHGAGRVAGDIEARKVGGLVLARAYGAFVVDFASETDGKIRSLLLSGREEQRPPGEAFAVLEDNLLKDPIAPFEP